MNQISRLILVFITFLVGVSVFGMNQKVQATILGVGLGDNVYKKQDVDNLGYPWVYNWEIDDTYRQNGNKPSKDFGDRYIPMLFNCTTTGINDFKNWIETNNYNSYVLILNEPERSDQGNCNADKAADTIKDLNTWKNADTSKRGNIKFIVGGTADGPYSNSWIPEFIAAYRSKNNGANPPIAGIHFHIYPRLVASVPSTVTDMSNQLTVWNNWLDNSSQNWLDNKEVWITEYGVLEDSAPSDRFTQYQTDQIYQQITDIVLSNPRIDRAAWFTFSYSTAVATNENRYRITSLTKPYTNVLNGIPRSKYTHFTNDCADAGKCTRIKVADTAVPLNLLKNVYSRPCAYGKWCKWQGTNYSSWNNITAAGKLELTNTAVSGQYGSCWIQWIPQPENGATYRLTGNYSSTNPFPNNKAFMQIEVQGNANYLSTPVYLNGSSGSFSRTFTYNSSGSFMSVKFCSWGSGLSSDRVVRLEKVGLEKLTGGGGVTF